jgi:pimeloyl-ACP methyl ester carboxylesterase
MSHAKRVATNGIELSVIDEGDGFPVLLCHGFPELSYSWRHQIEPLVAAGHRVIVPDQRGYGRSDRPSEITDYDIVHLRGDLLGLLDDIGAERAVFVGHDWGSIVVWSMALRHPERVAGVVGMSVPFVPRPPMPPIAMMRAAFGDTFFYMVYFQEPGVADVELAQDTRETMTRFLAGVGSDDPDAAARMFAPYGEMGMVPRLPKPNGLPAWLTQAELDHYIEEFEHCGFFGPVSWYRNMDRNWELDADLADRHVTVPSLFITGSNDPVRMMAPEAAMDGWLDDHRGSHIVDGAGHWVQQEKPDEVNAALLAFLDSLALT